MPVYKDQLGQSIQLTRVPQRIVSLVPSQSEFLWELGLHTELVGITKFCIHPKQMFNTVERVGGTKELNIEKIRALKPDLIIGNKEENDKGQIEALQKEFNVWMSDIITLNDAIDMMQSLAEICARHVEANKLSILIKKDLAEIKNSFHNKRVAYFMWNKPYMLAAKNTFIDSVLKHLGFENVIGEMERYPIVDEEKLIQLNPEICLLSTEPFPFNPKHANELKMFFPHSKVLVVNGEPFTWYGSRLLHLKRVVLDLKKEIG